MKYFLVLLTAVILQNSQAYAWGDLGHETTGEIAEQILAKKFPETKQAVIQILGVEPLAVAAKWPDQVRSDERFKGFSPYHFITILPDGTIKPGKNAMVVLQQYVEVLRNKKTPMATKKIALRYIVHVLGDIHQPLHVGNDFDFGGNACQVNWQPSNTDKPRRTNLHTAWDTTVVENILYKFKALSHDTNPYFDYKPLGKALMEKYKTIATAEEKIDLNAWVKEADTLTAQVYPDSLPSNARPYCPPGRNVGELPLDQIPRLDGAYVDAAAQIVEKQLVLAGVRIAYFLKSALADQPQSKETDVQILELLNKLSIP